MKIRPFLPTDLAQALRLTCEAFQPFYEESFPALMPHEADLVTHQHGQWRADYEQQLPALMSEERGGRGLVAVDSEGEFLGYLMWRPSSRADHAYIEILAVDPGARRQGVAESLMEHALTEMLADGRRFVELGTGGDEFHAPARRLYERMGFHAVPVVVYLRDLRSPITPAGGSSSREWLPTTGTGVMGPGTSATTDSQPVLYLTVGLPGSGKTTLAKQVAAREGIARLTPDEWMAPLFGDPEADGRRDVLEARLLDTAHQVLVSGAGVVVDFGCWSTQERWAIRAIAQASSARSQLLVADVEEAERRRRVRVRWAQAPETTFEMTETDLDSHLAAYQAPTSEELTAPALPPCPEGYDTWGHWASWRWPTLPLISTHR